MANRYWVNDDGDNDWNNANNWSSSEGAAGGAGVPSASDTVYFSDFSSAADCNLSANSACAAIYTTESNDWTGKLETGVYDLDITGVCDFDSATLSGATPTANGITAGSFDFASGSAIAASSGHIVLRANGNCDIALATKSSDEIQIHFLASSQFTHNNIALHGIEIDSGIEVDIMQNCFISVLASSGDMIINGTLDTQTNTIIFGGSAGSTISIGASGDFKGNGEIKMAGDPSLTYSNSGANFSFTGKMYTNPISADRPLMTGNWNYATLEIQGDSSGSTCSRTCFYSGNVICANYYIRGMNSGTTINLSYPNNNNISVEQNIDLHIDGLGTVNYTKTGGTLTKIVYGGNLNFRGKSVTDFIVNIYASETITMQSNGNVDSLAITAGKLNQSTYDLTSLGLTEIDGKWEIGASSNTGLTTAGLKINATAEITRDADAIVNNSGQYNVDASATFANPARGIYTQTAATTTFQNGSHTQDWKKATIDANITLSGNAVLTHTASQGGTIINATIDTNGNNLTFGSSASGEITFGASADISGAGDITFAVSNGATFTNNAGTFSATGIVKNSGSSNNMMLMADWRNATFRYYVNGDGNIYSSAGTLRCNNFELFSTSGGTMHAYNNNNSDIYVYNSLDFDTGAGTEVWHKGTGSTFYFLGTGTIAFNDTWIENIEIDSGADVTFSEIFVAEDFNVAGTADINENIKPIVENISGAGTLNSTGAETIIYYTNSNTFSGTLNNIVLVEKTSEQTPHAYYGMKLDRALKVRL